MIVWLNSDYLAAGSLISIDDRGFLIGDGAFETIYTERGRCAFLDAHLDRLRRSLEIIGLAADIAAIGWREIAARLAGENSIEGRAALRLTVTRGAGGRGLVAQAAAPTLLATLTPLAAPSDSLSLAVARQRRYSQSIASRAKLIGGYTDNLAAVAQARNAGADEAVMLNEHGKIACAGAGNLFVIAGDGAIATPRLEDGALAGIVRGLICAGDHGATIVERAVDPREMAGGAFFTNSLKGVVAARGDMGLAAGRTLDMLKAWYAERLARSLAEG